MPTCLSTHAAPLKAVAQLRGDICEPAELCDGAHGVAAQARAER